MVKIYSYLLESIPNNLTSTNHKDFNSSNCIRFIYHNFHYLKVIHNHLYATKD